MKRLIAFLLSAILMLPLCACFQEDTLPEPTEPCETETPNSTQSPKNGKTIVVDAGHGGMDGGAVGSNTGVTEASLNLAVAMLLRDELLTRGYDVIMTRTDENALADTKREDMYRRRDIMNSEGVDAVICVHMNKFSDTSVSGPMAFYYKENKEMEKFAKALIDGVCDSIGRPRRHANPGDYYLIRTSEPPCVIVECGFLSNPDDEAALQTLEHQLLLVQGIANGLDAFLFGEGS